MFRAYMLIIRRSKLHYIASGIITRIGGRLVHETYTCDDTRGCVMQFWPPDDKHMCSKHVETWNKLIVKQNVCASMWLITEINKLRCTSKYDISKTVGVPWKIIYISDIKQRPQNRSLWNPSLNYFPCRAVIFIIFHNDVSSFVFFLTIKPTRCTNFSNLFLE